MPTYGFSLNAEAATYNSLTISVTTASTGTSGETFTVAAEVSGTVISSATVTTGAEGESVNATIMGLSPSTTYTITGKINESPAAASITASTTAPSSDPRTATEAQWQDLANRVNNKQDTLTAGTGISIANNVISATGTGNAPLILTITPDQQDQYSFTWSGATIQQIETAFNAGTALLLSMGGNTLMVTNATFDDNSQNQRTAQLSICFAGVGSVWDLNPDGTGELHPFEYATTDQVATKASIALSTTDIGEGASLPANTLYGVYE